MFFLLLFAFALVFHVLLSREANVSIEQPFENDKVH